MPGLLSLESSASISETISPPACAVLKKRKRDEDWAAKKAAAAAEAKQKATASRKEIFKRAEQYVKEYRAQVGAGMRAAGTCRPPAGLGASLPTGLRKWNRRASQRSQEHPGVHRSTNQRQAGTAGRGEAQRQAGMEASQPMAVLLEQRTLEHGVWFFGSAKRTQQQQPARHSTRRQQGSMQTLASRCWRLPMMGSQGSNSTDTLNRGDRQLEIPELACFRRRRERQLSAAAAAARCSVVVPTQLPSCTAQRGRF